MDVVACPYLLVPLWPLCLAKCVLLSYGCQLQKGEVLRGFPGAVVVKWKEKRGHARTVGFSLSSLAGPLGATP